MSRSAFVEVNITNSTKLAQDSQNTADKAFKGVENLNDPNMMSVIEKQNNIVQFSGVTSQYNVLVQNAKADGIDTAALTTAYNNLNRFMADILADPDHAGIVDRTTYKKYQDAYNTELSKIQTALKNSFDTSINNMKSDVLAASQAASSAAIVASQATAIGNSASQAASQAVEKANEAKSAGDEATKVANGVVDVAKNAQKTADSAVAKAEAVGSQTSAEIVVQSAATVKAQSAADSALAKAQDVDDKTSAEIAKQSAATAKAQSTADSAFKEAQSATDYTDKQIASQASAVSEASKQATEASSKANSALDTANSTNAEITTLKGGSTLTIAQLEDGLGSKVSNDTFDSYKTQTASQFAQTVKQADFETYQTQTSKLIESKVDNGVYESDKEQTAGAIASKVSSSDFETYQAQTDKALASKVSNSDYESDKEQTASQIASKVSSSDFSTYKTQTDKLIGQKVDSGDFKTYQSQTAKLIESKVDNGTYQADKTQTANQIASKVSSTDFNSYKSQTDKLIESKVDNGTYQSDKTQTANQIADKVSNGAFNTYKTQTDKLIAEKVSNGDFSTYKTQTAGLINSKVDNGTYQSDKTQTASQIASKVSTGDFNSYKTQTANTLQTLIGKSPSNIIKDGGFNSPNNVGTVPSGWDFNNTAKIVSNADQASSLVAHGRSVLQINGRASGNSDIYYGDWFDVQPGDQFYAEFKVRWSSMSQKGAVILGIVTKNVTGQWNWYAGAITSSPSNWALHTGKLTIPNGAIQGRVWVSWQGSQEANGAVFLTDLIVRPAYSTQSDITQAINNIHLGFKNPNGSQFQMNLSADGVALLDFNKIMLNGSTNIANGTIGNAQIANGAITNAKIGNLAVGTAQIADAAITDAKVGNLSADHLKTGTIDFNTINGKNINASNITTGKMSADRLNVNKLSALSANLGDITTGSLKGVNIVANTFSTPNGSFTTDQNGLVTATSLIVRGSTNLVYNASLSGANGAYIPGWDIRNGGSCWIGNTHDGVPSIGFHANTGNGVWNNFAQTKLRPLNGDVYQSFSASVWFKEYGSDTRLQYQFTLAFFDSNRNRIDGGFTGNTWNGISSERDWRYVTIDNVKPPRNAVYVGLQYWAYNGNGNACFSSPMLTQTAKATGYQPDTGNVISAGIITGTVINGSTINGATFHGGDVINNQHNTSHLYPMTIEPNGTYKTTFYDQMVGLQSIIESGGLQHKFRSMVAGSDGHFVAYNAALDGQGFHSQSGYTTSKDSDFNKPQTITGYVDVTPATGIYLYGPTQQINFAGKADNMGSDGITMDAYGNVYAQDNSAWWRIGSNNGSHIVDFGIDKANQNQIYFHRDINMGNININRAHSITTKDGGGLYINSGRGGRANLNVASLNYTGSVSKSLLSEKKNVKKVDTSYWAQLVNSIDLATYQYKDDDNTSNLRLSGIVDDVNEDKQWNLPDIFVVRDEDGKLAGIENIVLQNAMLATIQEQQKEIDKLNGHLLKLEAKLNE